MYIENANVLKHYISFIWAIQKKRSIHRKKRSFPSRPLGLNAKSVGCYSAFEASEVVLTPVFAGVSFKGDLFPILYGARLNSQNKNAYPSILCIAVNCGLCCRNWETGYSISGTESDIKGDNKFVVTTTYRNRNLKHQGEVVHIAISSTHSPTQIIDINSRAA